MNKLRTFQEEVLRRIKSNGENQKLKRLSAKWQEEADLSKYEYNFSWLGRPVIQYPQDIVALQEIIWQVKPELIVETGVAHGGSLILYASILELLGRKGKVVGIDIEIHPHNREEIENHPLHKRIFLIEGHSLSEQAFLKVAKIAKGKSRILLCLDSNHTCEHVLSELGLYSRLVKKGSYIVVFDTSIEYLSGRGYPDRPWKKGNNPYTAVTEFLRINKRFVIDKMIQDKLLITSAPNGFLRCIKNS